LTQWKGIGLVNPGTVAYDTTQVDNGYTLEMEIRLDSLGFASVTDTVQVMIDIFDPDGYHKGSVPWDGPATRAFDKTWWGSEWGPAMRVVRLDKTVGVELDEPGVPSVFALAQNYPNPFNPSTTIRFDVPSRSFITLVLYDMLGREVTTLAKGEYSPGYHRALLNGANLASGVYLYRMISNSLEAGHDQPFVAVKKLILMK